LQMNTDIYSKPGALVVELPDNALPLAEGVSQKPLFENAEIAIRQLQLIASHTLPKGNLACDRFYIVLHGELTINPVEASGSANDTDSLGTTLGEEALVYIPRQTDAAERLSAGRADVTLLEVELLSAKAKPRALKLDQGTWLDEQLLIVSKEQAFPYIPAEHDNTSNHCLFINDDIEVLLSCIEVGGGADVHTHEREDQCTYVRNPAPAKLLYYPKGVEHGGITNIPARHDLVLIYFPPKAECLSLA